MVSQECGREAPRCERLQWSHVFSDMVRTDADRRIVKVEQLQWSHVFSDMVSGGRRIRIPGDRPASMEPCLFRHGKIHERTDRRTPGTGFNGAMSFQTW